ncbi:KpsF/GutQ family sugar-phosphate isomerase [Futiania mangrovi]|uniref:KpsF/GutQ family sugar-phosphate isomerase n=1 Tax=Futiania mangrovi TaxID=2959716 RepID=A0A9J6PET7_9PROT|nr:KpsF/GutQ family sugar-phosphate isomerase [Futiania mangrovii]MCP1337201.1 KpsF/GutQ family sugar-phosphate isomerase [Futiania mangrovii]
MTTANAQAAARADGQTGRDVAAGRRALSVEIAGLTAMSAALDGSFSAAVDLVARTTGRTILSGMGKSGHICAKIAATFASTGTPAQFVHPGEASHGDLGMIRQGDSVICLSNSGETSELADLIAHTRRFSIPLIGMVGRAESTLARSADVALVLPKAEEACPNGLAPTTSTTMMLALGDALAVALMERRGFSAEDFRTFHPGGRLGARLVRVRDIMHTGTALPLVTPETALGDALIEMTSKSFGCVGIEDGAGRLVGIVTDGDLRRHMQPDLLTRKVADVMTARPKTIRADALAVEAVSMMQAAAITSVFVVEGEPGEGVAPRIAGFVNIHDCLRAGVV